MAIIGLGFGTAVHLPAIARLPDVRIVALLGRDPGRTESAAARCGAIACSSLDALIAQQPDGVVVAVPPAANPPILHRLLAQDGLAILSEKPMGAAVGALEALVHAAERHVTGVDFELGELAAFRALKQLVHSRRLGGPRGARILWTAQSRAWRLGEWCWKTDAARGGGAMTLFGSHLLYLVEDILGPIESLRATAVRQLTEAFAPTGSDPAEHRVTLDIALASGAEVALALDIASPQSAFAWEVEFDRGHARIDNPHPERLTGCRLRVYDSDGVAIAEVQDPADEEDGRIAPVARLLARFVDHARRSQRFEPGFAAGLRVQRLLAACDRAARSGQAVACAAA